MSPPNKYIKPNYDLINRNLPFHGIATLAGSAAGIGHISCTVKPLCGLTVKPHQLFLFKQAPWAGERATWGLSTTNSPILTVRARETTEILLSFQDSPLILAFYCQCAKRSYAYYSDLRGALNLHQFLCVCVSKCPPSYSLSRWRKQTCFISLLMARCY